MRCESIPSTIHSLKSRIVGELALRWDNTVVSQQGWASVAQQGSASWQCTFIGPFPFLSYFFILPPQVLCVIPPQNYCSQFFISGSAPRGTWSQTLHFDYTSLGKNTLLSRKWWSKLIKKDYYLCWVMKLAVYQTWRYF